MTAQTDPYVRVYASIRTDPKFATIYRDDALLGCWLRLLLAADAAHPAASDFPMGTDMDRVQRLADVGLIDLVGHGCYIVRGLTKEREKRSANGRASAQARWSDATAMRTDATASSRIAPPMRPHTPEKVVDADPMLAEPSLAEPSLAEQIQAEPRRAIARAHDGYGLPHLTEDVVAAAEEASGRSISTLHGTWAGELDRLVEDRGADAVSSALRRAASGLGAKPSWPQLVAGVRNILEPLPSSTSKPSAPDDPVADYLRRMRAGKVK